MARKTWLLHLPRRKTIVSTVVAATVAVATVPMAAVAAADGTEETTKTLN